MKHKVNYFLLLIATAQLSGCVSLGKGVAEAFLENQQSVDTRLCEVWGTPFKGISPFLDNKQGKTKVLMVHGVGDHSPGYSTQFLEKLATELDLPVMSKEYKNITLTTSLLDTSKNLATRRTDANNLLKKFSNDAGPDPIMYLGESKEDILASFGQSHITSHPFFLFIFIIQMKFFVCL